MNKIVAVTDYDPSPIESLKGAWGIYRVEVLFTNGGTAVGSMQGDTHLWAFETFEAE